jgi:hypothetical protein
VIPTAPGATKPPGTELGNGFTVPDGAVLVGFPIPRVQGQGWRAVLLVEGDPRSAIDGLTGQAERAGFSVNSGCRRTRYGGVPAFECEAAGTQQQARRSVFVSLYRGLTGFGPASHMIVSYADDLSGAGGSSISDQATSTPPSLPTRWPALARTGEYLFRRDGEPTDITTGRAPKVEPGTVLLAPVAPSGGFQPYNWFAVLQVEGSARAAAERYRRQFAAERDYGQVGSVQRVAMADGVIRYAFSTESLGDADWQVNVFDTPDGSWMTIAANAQT